MALTVLTLVACSLYLLPLLALIALLRKPQASALALASNLGCWFALDLLATFWLMRIMRLEQAVFLRTALLIGAALFLAVRRLVGDKPMVRARSALSRADLLAVVLAAVLGFAFTHSVSSEYWIWDREWHIPFTASLRSQRLPIFNVYEPGRPFRYHLIGNLSGAMLQALSFGAMSAARALAFAHDLQATLLSVMIALCFRAMSKLSVLTCAVGALVPLLAGPAALRNHPQGGMGVFEGYADFSNLSLSYRPHCSVALVLLVTTFCHVARWSEYRTRGQSAPWTTVLSLGPVFMLLGIADEISGLVLGGSLGVIWLCWPRMLGKKFWHGAAFLAGFAVLALVANLMLAGTIAPGGVVSHAELLAPRLPRFYASGLPLSFAAEPWVELLFDVGPLVIPMAVVTYVVIRRPGPSERLKILTCFTASAAIFSLFLFLCVEVNGRTFEGHRFLTSARILTPLLGLLFLITKRWSSFVSVAVLGPILAGVFASIGFVYGRLPDYNRQTKSQYSANCRTEYNARLGETMTPTWIEDTIWYEYAGCHPIFAAAATPPGDVVLVGWPALGSSAFAKMDEHFFPRGEAARMVCSSDSTKTTPFCKKVQEIGQCHPQGTLAVECLISAEKRAEIRKL
ncbi:MAG TPA: hypothetical protein VJV79_19340 [Polyangiaceae bacterium]|nr:hypothetical protein [Polyangiaceae bacterium]